MWKDRGSDFSVGPMKLRRTYLVANEEYKNEQLTRALFTYLGVVNSWCVGKSEGWWLVLQVGPIRRKLRSRGRKISWAESVFALEEF